MPEPGKVSTEIREGLVDVVLAGNQLGFAVADVGERSKSVVLQLEKPSRIVKGLANVGSPS